MEKRLDCYWDMREALDGANTPPLELLTAEEAKESRNRAQAIQIGDGRYAIIVHCDDGGSLCPHEMKRLRRGLARRWDSEDKFIVLQDGAWGTFTFERMPDD